jgi:hypothetical protein
MVERIASELLLRKLVRPLPSGHLSPDACPLGSGRTNRFSLFQGVVRDMNDSSGFAKFFDCVSDLKHRCSPTQAKKKAGIAGRWNYFFDRGGWTGAGHARDWTHW